MEKDAISAVLEVLSHDGSDFYNPAHEEIFKCMVSLYEDSVPVDVITLAERLKNAKFLDSLGGISYLGVMVEMTPTAANITYYANIVRDKALLRKLINASSEIVTRGYMPGESVDDFIDDAERIIFDVSQNRIKVSFLALKDIIKDTFEAIEKLYENQTHVTGVPTGYKDLDNLTAGFQPSDLIIVAGRPSMGKTALALNMAEHAAIEAKCPVAVFSLEMSKEQLTQRMLASRARVDLGRLRKGFLKDEDWNSLTTAVGTLYEAPIYIDDTPAQTVLQVRAKARRLKVSEKGLGLIIVDYLQLMRGRGRMDNREQEISEISRGLKALAKELNVPVMALSQLSRRTEQRERNVPQLSDLRESGAIEQDADVVMFVYRESVYKPCDCPKELCTCGVRRGAEIIVAKQRNGPIGTVNLTFMNEFTRFEDQTQVDYGDVQGEWVE